jgi:cellulose biosynthesis protein BcsQ
MPDPSAPIITFYSYKGGTGRSMSLANTAWILASNGSRVLIVDWDLEAPGLHRFFHPFLPDPELRSSPGLIDLMWEFAAAALDPQTTTESGWHEDFARIQRYAMSVEHQFPGVGTIDLVPAGKQDQLYSTQVTSFDWNNFYERLGGGGFLQALKRGMREEYDYVLIDSRTGISDISGICTVHMPDIVVSCFTLSTQAIDGSAAVASSVQSQRRGDPLRIFPVPMRVEDGEQDKLEASRDYARARFGQFLWHVPDPERYWGEVEVPYKSFYAYEEILAPIGDRPQQQNTILAVTERLTGYLTDQQVTALGGSISEPDRRKLLRSFERGRSSSTDSRATAHLSGDARRVFICYAYDSAVRFDAIREMWSLLRDAGVDARLDRAPGQRPPSWPDWQAEELRAADLVIVVASPGYGELDELEVSGLRDAYNARPRRFVTVELPDAVDSELPAFLAIADIGKPPFAAVTLTALTAEGIDHLVRQIKRQRLASADPIQARREDPGGVTDPSLIKATDSLREAVRQQWTFELAQRQIFDPSPLSLRWARRDRLSSAGGGGRVALAGVIPELPALLMTQPRTRLVILGSPGSGKTVTAAILVLRLCEQADAGTPVPVLLSAGSWDPRLNSLRDWLIRQLTELYPSLDESAAKRLIEASLILPVIDGLDEMAPSARNHAIAAISRELPLAGLVVTSRTTEYEEMAGLTGESLPGAAVVELEPVSGSSAIDFIQSRNLSDDRRWEPVFQNIRIYPDSPVAKALATPLMVSLAGQAYRSPKTNPSELLEFQDGASLEQHLFEIFIKDSYSPDSISDVYGPGARYSAAAARRWLTSIALQMDNDNTHDLAWWRLERGASTARKVAVATALLAVPAAGLSVAAYVLLDIQVYLVFQIIAVGIALSPILGIATGRASPEPHGLRSSTPIRKSSESSPLDPQTVLRTDRRSALLPSLVTLIAGSVAVLAAALTASHRLLVAIGFGPAVLLLTTLAFSLSRTAWGRFSVARIVLAAQGSLPVRVMSFLNDACTRGVLRRSGLVYQFRHASLQEMLSSSPGDPAHLSSPHQHSAE